SFYLNNDILCTTSFSENQKDENPLKIKWSINQNKIFEINEMTGSFSGIDILFQKENEKVLFGSVKLDLFKLKKIMPIPVEDAISKFDLRKGYEFSGRLFLDFSKNKNFKFQGLFSGKDFELLGYRFKTMLSSVEIDPSKLNFQNLKISDTSGILSIKNFLLEKNEISWQINIPNLKIKDLRPSLMQKIDHPLGEMTPFLVRELNLNEFKGNVNDRKSFSGKGNLHFINSFKRNHSVFEFPADVLSRIVGLDQELLTPVKGKVDLKVSDGKFYIKDLQDSFSEGERSKFFLHDKGQKPYVDFDGNIYLNIAMKQYVLFKFTESFVISIRGDLQEPKYNLKKKRGFLN
ncbi:MAG: hypothetical protein JXA94_05825, partial [Parachlamydiales bacterium]|nr:hypothetical protein [Parachlamydiales bacterium]